MSEVLANLEKVKRLLETHDSVGVAIMADGADVVIQRSPRDDPPARTVVEYFARVGTPPREGGPYCKLATNAGVPEATGARVVLDVVDWIALHYGYDPDEVAKGVIDAIDTVTGVRNTMALEFSTEGGE